MNLRPAFLFPGIACFACIACIACAACSHRQKSDWRVPGPGASPTPCASDADCNGGTCGIEMGATQGTCSGPGNVLQAPGDGGVAPPAPTVQPSSSDIQI